MNEYQRGALLLWRALLLRCPDCGRPTFARGLLRVHTSCRVCGLLFEHDDGFFLGANIVGYTLTFFVAILPPTVLVATGEWDGVTATVVAIGLCLVLPVLLYWHSKALWMAIYYWVAPEDLRPVEDEPGRVTYHPREGIGERERLLLEEAIVELEGGKPVYRPGPQ